MLFMRKGYAFKEAIWQLAQSDFLLNALRRLVLPQFAFLTIRLQSGAQLDLVEDANKQRPYVEVLKSRDVAARRQISAATLDSLCQKTQEYVLEMAPSANGKAG
jgi:DNA-binding GntR family transcriptional regulator